MTIVVEMVAKTVFVENVWADTFKHLWWLWGVSGSTPISAEVSCTQPYSHSVLDIYCSLTTLPSFSRSFPFSLTLSIPLKSSHVYSHVGVCLSESWDYITQHFILKNRIDNFLHLLKFIFAELIRYFSTLRVFFQLIIFWHI